MAAQTPQSAGTSDMPVVILCGGKGTRLKEETEFIPKPLIPIGDKPILWHIMKIYYAQGFRHFVLLLGYKGDQIKRYFFQQALYSPHFTIRSSAKGPQIDYHMAPEEAWDVTFIDTGLETQTGGRLKAAADFLKKEKTFLFTYGDGVGNINLKKLLAGHEKSGAIATLTGVHHPGQYGEIRLEKDAFRFYEKPSRPDVYINGGFFALDRRIFDRIPAAKSTSFEQNVLPRLAKSEELHVVPHDGYWQSMDTLRDAELLNATWASGKAPWKIWK
jgi:glucose-1-phosphate cytidylyltransferase